MRGEKEIETPREMGKDRNRVRAKGRNKKEDKALKKTVTNQFAV